MVASIPEKVENEPEFKILIPTTMLITPNDSKNKIKELDNIKIFSK